MDLLDAHGRRRRLELLDMGMTLALAWSDPKALQRELGGRPVIDVPVSGPIALARHVKRGEEVSNGDGLQADLEDRR